MAAKIPDATALGARPIPTAQAGIYEDRSGAILSQGVQSLGSSIAKVGSDLQASQSEFETALANANLAAADADLRKKNANNPNYTEEDYEKDIIEARDSIAEGIGGRRDQRMYTARANSLILSGKTAVWENQQRVQLSNNRALLDKYLSNGKKKILDEGNPLQHEGWISHMHNLLDVAWKNKVITGEERQAKSEDFVLGYSRAWLDSVDPAVALEELKFVNDAYDQGGDIQAALQDPNHPMAVVIANLPRNERTDRIEAAETYRRSTTVQQAAYDFIGNYTGDYSDSGFIGEVRKAASGLEDADIRAAANIEIDRLANEAIRMKSLKESEAEQAVMTGITQTDTGQWNGITLMEHIASTPEAAMHWSNLPPGKQAALREYEKLLREGKDKVLGPEGRLLISGFWGKDDQEKKQVDLNSAEYLSLPDSEREILIKHQQALHQSASDASAKIMSEQMKDSDRDALIEEMLTRRIEGHQPFFRVIKNIPGDKASKALKERYALVAWDLRDTLQRADERKKIETEAADGVARGLTASEEREVAEAWRLKGFKIDSGITRSEDYWLPGDPRIESLPQSQGFIPFLKSDPYELIDDRTIKPELREKWEGWAALSGSKLTREKREEMLYVLNTRPFDMSARDLDDTLKDIAMRR